MVFSSPGFLFLFLPIFLILYFLVGKRLQNPFLVVASLIFYAWGEPKYVFVLITSIILNHIFGNYVSDELRNGRAKRAKLLLGLAVALNLALLFGFKYVNFFAASLSSGLNLVGWKSIYITSSPVSFPIGISFFTFSAISYIVDIYRKEAVFDRNPINTALYISLFPKLLAGPIVQYRHIANQIAERSITMDKFADGVKRFIIGLGKKVLIANTLGMVADQIFSLPGGELTVGVSWLGIVCYTLQIYFDFSGYSDMAIGIGRIAGFDFMENFNYPYISRSIREFWRRWHISLSTWLRDYLYIPLGGNRGKPVRVYFNILIVFFVCGLWHGAAWTFVAWGVWHGVFVLLEHTKFGQLISRTWSPVRLLYALLVVMIGWVVFRSSDFSYAIAYLEAMFGFGKVSGPYYSPLMYLNRLVVVALIVGLVGSLPLLPALGRLKDTWYKALEARRRIASGLADFSYSFVTLIFLGTIFSISVISMMGALNNPFIYFRF